MIYNRKLIQFTLTFLLSALFFAPCLLAQTETIALKKYGVEEGLPEEYAQHLVQDEQGYIWIGTQNGLVKYDGYNFTIYKASKDSLKTNLPRQRSISTLFKGRNEKLWISGVQLPIITNFNARSGTFNSFYIKGNPTDSLKIMFVTPLQEDLEGYLWFNVIGQKNNQFVSRLGRLNPQDSTSLLYNVTTLDYSRINNAFANPSFQESKLDSSIWVINSDYKVLRWDKSLNKFDSISTQNDKAWGLKITEPVGGMALSTTGEIAFGTGNYINIYNPLSKKTIFEADNLGTSLPQIAQGQFDSGFYDKNNTLWLTHNATQSITSINAKDYAIETYKLGEGKLNFYTLKNTALMLQSKTPSGFWLSAISQTTGKIQGYLHYDSKLKNFKFYDYKINKSSNSHLRFPFNATDLLEDKTGLLWIPTWPNFYKQDPKSQQFQLFVNNPDADMSIVNNNITTFNEDSQKQLWIGTSNGLSKYLGNGQFKTYTYSTDNNKTSLGHINKIFEDADKQLWVTTNTGLYKKKAETDVFYKIKNSNLTEYRYRDINQDSNGIIWTIIINNGISTVHQLNAETDKIITSFNAEESGMDSQFIYSIFIDFNKNVWLGESKNSGEKGLFRYNDVEKTFKNFKNDPNDETSLSNNEVRVMFEDDLNRLWIGTDEVGLNLYDPETESFIRNKDHIDLTSIQSYLPANDGKVWVGTYSGGGLALIGKDPNTYKVYGENEGLLHNDIGFFGINRKIPQDHLGHLWLPTKRGVSVFNPKTETFKSYTEKDGLQKMNLRSPAIVTSDGSVWIGGENGLNMVHPSQLLNKDSIAPNVVITDMSILDQNYSAADNNLFKNSVAFTEKVDLQYFQKDISFKFVGLHYLRPEENRYSFKLENYNEKWTQPSTERSVSYTNLSPGTYTFKVRASNADGVWNEVGAQIKIVIYPPWWKTWWAYLLYFIGLILIIYAFLKWRTKKLQKEKYVLEHKVNVRTQELKTSIEDLKDTQTQLIQSEKMASLGELTAGIAHEIQNPLNFVNNFSEVSNELIDEMNEELDKGDIEEAKFIASDIKQNLEKINHHGKRADGIVKGMLQHSRKNTGKKEATDINKLADEYFRLAYHGLRAKDKSFNAQLETDYDDNIKTVNIIQQDIGRVILNLFTNAFYAVNEKKKSGLENYKPTVAISTRKTKDLIEIKVTDNGNGIPKSVKEKIFQPFFTTKPTGQGTGLGLSMSYDIITKGHGGELTVDSKEGKGTTFSIKLPLNS